MNNVSTYKFDANTYGTMALLWAPDCLADLNKVTQAYKKAIIAAGDFYWPYGINLCVSGNYSDGVMLYADLTF